MEFTKTNDGFVKYDENGRVIAEITYAATNNPNKLSLIILLLILHFEGKV